MKISGREIKRSWYNSISILCRLRNKPKKNFCQVTEYLKVHEQKVAEGSSVLGLKGWNVIKVIKSQLLLYVTFRQIQRLFRTKLYLVRSFLVKISNFGVSLLYVCSHGQDRSLLVSSQLQ